MGGAVPLECFAICLTERQFPPRFSGFTVDYKPVVAVWHHQPPAIAFGLDISHHRHPKLRGNRANLVEWTLHIVFPPERNHERDRELLTATVEIVSLGEDLESVAIPCGERVIVDTNYRDGVRCHPECFGERTDNTLVVDVALKVKVCPIEHHKFSSDHR